MKSSRYAVEIERGALRTESIWFVIDTWSSNRAIVYRCRRSGEAWRVAADANAGRRAL